MILFMKTPLANAWQAYRMLRLSMTRGETVIREFFSSDRQVVPLVTGGMQREL